MPKTFVLSPRNGRAQRWYQAAPQNAVDNRRRIPAEALEAVVRDQMNEEVDSHEFTQRFIAELRRAADALTAEREALAADRKAVAGKIANLLRLAEKTPDSASVAA